MRMGSGENFTIGNIIVCLINIIITIIEEGTALATKEDCRTGFKNLTGKHKGRRMIRTRRR